MTRYTRNRQRIKAIHMETGIVTKYHMEDKNLPVSRYRAALEGREIDPTFKWVRTVRANFRYDADANVTYYYVDKNVIHWTKIENGVIVKYNMNPKVGNTVSYRLWGKKDA